MAIADEDEDFRMALELQLQINEENEYRQSLQTWDRPSTKAPAERSVVPYSSRRDLSVVDAFWELNDPNPNVHSLFVEFNEAFFFGKLSGVEVRWSPRMTLCAGLCCYEGKGGLCSVRLSEPLLKLRPRKDLVETLLHEMIHAYLFVTHNNKDHDAHGPEFHKHMERINKASGAHITVYHNFHGEVASYRTHWWRCNGPCQHRRPFFGIVKRAMNRPPSDKDLWWADHQRTCGGSFIKIREPEPKASKSKRRDGVLHDGNAAAAAAKKSKMADGTDIRTLLVPQRNIKAAATSVPATHVHQGARPKQSEPSVSSFPGIMKRLPSNVHTLSQPVVKSKTDQVVAFSGRGCVLGGNSSISRIAEKSNLSSTDRSSLPVSSCVLGTPLKERHNLQADRPRAVDSAGSSPGHLGSKDGTQVKLTAPKLSRSSQPTLTDLLGKRTSPTKQVSRRRSAARMKFIRELLSSDSESDSECVITKEDFNLRGQETCSGKMTEQSMSISSPLHTILNTGATANASMHGEPRLVECPACGSFMEEQHINRHLDVCLIQDD
ncbi:DNA-dependent metalloprotease SPRTN isoform X3 [Rhipicephalus sanguineus]|uniref:DNA-dependent metalloprotease SPRTN isoform X3 n=1 Tax=Rhipicephalus sanguineus TaxID=34632 RepID=UPI0018956164|nr:DNA-dependent metalloprotease SPRTN isoform X3 [Rhipicephalus sanguineus]